MTNFVCEFDHADNLSIRYHFNYIVNTLCGWNPIARSRLLLSYETGKNFLDRTIYFLFSIYFFLLTHIEREKIFSVTLLEV
jgi:hypothetical protein